MAVQTTMQWDAHTDELPPADTEGRGFVPTPDSVVDLMVDKMFHDRAPTRRDLVLDSGCGQGHFIAGVLRWCHGHRVELPRIIGVEIDPSRAAQAVTRFADVPSIEILREDFLFGRRQQFDYIIGNPPYVPITSLGEEDKAAFRQEFTTATGRFDLYMLFFEKALRSLKNGGRLVFITPEKFLYVKTAEPLRRLLGRHDVREIHLLDEATFADLVTYPTVTTVDNTVSAQQTAVRLRNGKETQVEFPRNGDSLQPVLQGHVHAGSEGDSTLDDICLRVSCGVATGADAVYVQRTRSLPAELHRFAFPTISGRQLVPGQGVESCESMLIPYDRHGALLPFEQLGALGRMLATPMNRNRLDVRTCVRRKPWYAFHDSAPLDEILRPKLLCKDITAKPAFWIDREGTLVPRHSVYYIVPRDPTELDRIADYLNSPQATAWLKAHCQRAANGFLRLQSAILKRLPIPGSLAAPLSGNTAQRASRRAPNPARYGELVLSR